MAMKHQPTQLLSRVWSGPVGVCVIGLQLDFLLHSSLISDHLVGFRRPYDPTVPSTVELGGVMCHGLKAKRSVPILNFIFRLPAFTLNFTFCVFKYPFPFSVYTYSIHPHLVCKTVTSAKLFMREKMSSFDA